MSSNRSFPAALGLRLRAAKQQVRGTRLADLVDRIRHDLHYEDVFLVSFPKSGNTWARFLLTGVYLWHETRTTGEPTEFIAEPNYYNIHSYVPDLHITNSRRARVVSGFPRILKSHRPATSLFSRVILVVRDPRDTMLSRFHFLNRRETVFPSFEEFIQHPHFGVSSWVSHTASWLSSPQRAQGRLLLVRFEDLQRHPSTELERMLGFLNLAASRQCLDWSVAMANRRRVRDLEERLGRPRPAPVPFMRKGTSGQWVDSMDRHHLAVIEDLAGPTLEICGYRLSRTNGTGSLPVASKPNGGESP